MPFILLIKLVYIANLVLSPGITLTRSIYRCNKINRRVRGSSIEDLKVRRKGEKGGSQSICLWSYYRSGFKLYPFADVRKHP
jgi:hypothetical protein